MFSNFKTQKGQSLIEILIAMALVAILLPAILTGFVVSREGKAQEGQKLVAITLLKESEEAVRSVREKGWTGFAVNGTYHPAVAGSAWSLVTGSEVIDGLTREIVISDVLRDVGNNIVESGGTIDADTKKVVSTVSWNSGFIGASSEVLTTYLTNWSASGPGPTPTPTPAPSTCNGYALSQGYGSGTCRQNTVQCTGNEETNLAPGDVYCTGGPSADTCCALSSSTPTPTPTPTPPATCNAYCASLGGYTSGTCRKGVSKCTANGETHESGGNSLCQQAEGGTCCCLP